MEIDTMDLLQELIYRLNPIRDRYPRDDGRYEYHIHCPVCGKDSSPKNTHCTFSINGWKCFSCGSGGQLPYLAYLVGIKVDDPGKMVHHPPVIEKKREFVERQWMQEGAGKFLLPKRYEMWKDYRPALSMTNIARCKLGVGQLPSSDCKHERLIVPIFNVAGELRGLRGRALTCGCEKWLVAAGTSPEYMPLYNIEAVKPGGIIFVVENPIDALLISQVKGRYGVATYSTSYWNPEWGEQLAEKSPELVFVMYDNDLPGNGGGNQREQFIDEWMENPKHTRIPPSSGIRMMGRLKEILGPIVELFDWDLLKEIDGALPANKLDVGSVVA